MQREPDLVDSYSAYPSEQSGPVTCRSVTPRRDPPIAIYVPTLVGGGAEHSMVRLANGLAARGHGVELVAHHLEGPWLAELDERVMACALTRYGKLAGRLNAVAADPARWRVMGPVIGVRRPLMGLRYLPGLVDYLNTARPRAVVSALTPANLLALWASRRAIVNTRIIVTQRNTLSAEIDRRTQDEGEGGRWRRIVPLIAATYPYADAVVTVSDGVADDLSATTGLARSMLTTIYNPVISPALERRAAGATGHAWLDEPDGTPVIVAAGRLVRAKGFDVLLAAFARLVESRAARLIVLGEGDQRQALVQQAHDLDIAARVDFVGRVDPIEPWLARARVYVLSSRHEGLPATLIEALGCGCPVVATNCPSGPAEILDHGRYGRLVPVEDPEALAAAIGASCDTSLDRDQLIARAACFDVDTAVDHYESLIG